MSTPAAAPTRDVDVHAETAALLDRALGDAARAHALRAPASDRPGVLAESPSLQLMPYLVDALRTRPDLLAGLLGVPLSSLEAELAGIRDRLSWLADDPTLPADTTGHLRFCATAVNGAINRRQEAPRA